MVDINTLTNGELAAAVDLYVQKIVAGTRDLTDDRTVYVSISAYVWAHDKNYCITHSLMVEKDSEKQEYKTNNLFGAVDAHATFLSVSAPLAEPTQVTPLLAAPIEHEYAEYKPVVSNAFDEVPF